MDTGSGTTGVARPWALIPSDILGVVLRFLPCLSDRARLRCVCRSWCAAARVNRPPPPLPLLILSGSTFSSLSPGDFMTTVRSFPVPEAVAHNDVQWVGSFEGWLVGTSPRENCRIVDGDCFLLNPFSQDVICLPSPGALHLFGSNASCEVNDAIIFSVVLNCSPDSGAACIVAAVCANMTQPRLEVAVCRPGMTSWCVCDGDSIASPGDIVFCQGNLYMLSGNTTDLFAFELGEHEDGTPVISPAKLCVTEPLPSPPSINDMVYLRCKLVEWQCKLLLVIRYMNLCDEICRIDVLALDYGCKEIKSLDGESIFISKCCNKSFPASQYDGVEEDCIYFLDHCHFGEDNESFDALVYNMRDETIGPFTGRGSKDYKLPMWFFPSQ